MSLYVASRRRIERTRRIIRATSTDQLTASAAVIAGTVVPVRMSLNDWHVEAK